MIITEEEIPKMTRVKSSAIAGVGYKDNKLYVHFSDGKTESLYRYIMVPEHIFDELLKSQSKGKYIVSKVKPKYKSETLISSRQVTRPDRPLILSTMYSD